MHLIIGGAGFLGSHLVDELLQRGDRVRVLDAFTRRPNDDPQRKRRHVKRWGTRVDVVEGDVRDPIVVAKCLMGVRRVYHLGHFVGSRLSFTDSAECLGVNVMGTQTLLEAMDSHRVKNLVMVSSGSVYGDCPTGAVEGDSTVAGSPFAASMIAAEALCQSWQASTASNAVIVRPFHVIGPRMRPDSAVRSFLTSTHRGRPLALFGSGTSRKDYVYAADVIDVLLQARRAISPSQPAIFNSCRGRTLSLLELVELVGQVTGRAPKIEFLPAPPGEVSISRGSTEHTARTLDCRAQVGIRRGLEHTLAWLAASKNL